VTVRGETTSLCSTAYYEEKGADRCSKRPGMTIFSPDGKYGYVCSSIHP